jgi:hypothetical protein
MNGSFFPRFSMCSGDFVDIYGSGSKNKNKILKNKFLDMNIDKNSPNKGDNADKLKTSGDISIYTYIWI